MCRYLDRLRRVEIDHGSARASTTPPASRTGRGLLLGAVVVASGVGLMFLHYYGGLPGDPEGFLAALGFGSPTVGSGLLTLVAARKRVRSLFFAAATALVLVSSLSIITLPLIAAALAIAREGWLLEHRSTRSQFLVSAVASTGLASAAFSLVVHQDSASWETATHGGGSSSDIVTGPEAIVALGLVCISLAVGIGATYMKKSSAPSRLSAFCGARGSVRLAGAMVVMRSGAGRVAGSWRGWCSRILGV